MNGETDTMYYIHKDYLGSYDVITNEQGEVVERLSFDPWGRRRNATNWTYTNVPSSHHFDRGYTGHEHLDIFGLINMNGRVYDPWLGRFLSPDPFVQSPGNSQSYNRYSYCLNNPLKYVDPSGYSYKPIDWNDKVFISPEIFRGFFRQDISPGSGNHWSDPLRSDYGNFMIMNENTFVSSFGSERYSYQYLQHVIIPYMLSEDVINITLYQKPGKGGDWGYYEDAGSEWTSVKYSKRNGRFFGYFSGTVTAKWVSMFSGNLVEEGEGAMEIACNIANAINEYNPIANFWDVIAYAFTGKDRFGNSMNLGQGMLKAAGVLPVGKVGNISVKTLQLMGRARTAEQGLMLGERFLGNGYNEIAPGVFRSADGLRQFRMTNTDLLGYGFNDTPHIHFERYYPFNLNTPYVNWHVPLINP